MGRGGRGGEGGGVTTNLCTINLRESFLLVKPSTLDLVNVWGPA